MNKIFVIVFAVLFAIFSIQIEAASSFGGRSSSSFSSRSISVSPSRSYSSPSRNSSSISVNRNSNASSNSSFYNKGNSSNVKLYEQYTNRNSKPPLTSSGKIDTKDIDKTFSSSYRSERRRNYYGDYVPSNSYAPVIVSHPSYGPWDTMLMWSILDNVGDKQMYYNHMNDPSYVQWRQDAEQLAKTDPEVAKKLAELDKQVTEMKNKGIKQNSNYFTPGIDSDIYEANNIDFNSLSELKVCTGTIGSDYSRFANELSKITKLKVKQINTNGSVDNLNKIASGECDLGFVQEDIIKDSSAVVRKEIDFPHIYLDNIINKVNK